MALTQNDKPVHLIVNPRSGYGGSKHMLGLLRTAARQRGLELVQYTTTAPGDATRYARSIAGKTAAAMVWGGDGTVNETATGLAGSDTAILPCPVGTENLLAKELCVPGQPEKIIDLLVDGKVVPCDLGTINDRTFLMIVGVGFDGEVVHRLVADRTGHITHLSYFWPIWRTFWSHKYPRMKVVLDGEEIFDDHGLIFVGNISRYATGLRICRDACFNDRLLDLVIFKCNHQAFLARHAARTVLKRHVGRSDMIYRQFSHVTIETPGPVPSQIDGDPGPDTPLSISVAPEQIQLIVPQQYRARNQANAGDQPK